MMLLWVSPPGIAQIEVAQKEETSTYFVDVISFASATSNLSRIDVYVQVPYTSLSFVKTDDQYSASYEITIDILDSTGQLASEKMWTEGVKTSTFDQSVSAQAYSLVQRNIEVAPGTYSVVTIVRDNETRQSRKQARALVVSNFALPEFSLSDIMLVAKMSTSGERKTIVPNVSPNVGTIADSFHIFFEAYNPSRLDSIRFSLNILNDKKENVSELTRVQTLQPGRNPIFIKINNSSLAAGNYLLFVRAYEGLDSSQADQKSIASTSRAFVVRWRGMPKGIKNIDLAIEQCVYIAKDKEMDFMREAKTPEEKQKRFMEFWKKRDPNPNTPRNEKMEQYYDRVDFANKTFKHYLEGWRTDMGMVYIIFGPPNNVDRHPFDIDSKPYEVWSYYEINHSFVFVDQSGFGDYRLTEPLWDVWQRPKD